MRQKYILIRKDANADCAYAKVLVAKNALSEVEKPANPIVIVQILSFVSLFDVESRATFVPKIKNAPLCVGVVDD